MNNWVEKESYRTRLIADENTLNKSGVEIQEVEFFQGKFGHYHKEKTEFFCFTGGNGYVVIDGKGAIVNGKELSPKEEKIHIQNGTELIIPPNVRHEFINENEEPLVAIMFKTNSKISDTFSD